MLSRNASRPYRILIVDDVSGERVAIERALRAAVDNCEVVAVDSVESAGKAIQERLFPFDLAVLDLRLVSNAEALELLGRGKTIQRRSPVTSVIVYTAYPGLETACAAYESGADAYISKLDSHSTEKLQKKARELLLRQHFREDLRKRMEAQQRAEEYLSAHREKMVRKYGGMFVLWQEGKVLGSYDSVDVVLQELEKLSTDDRLGTAVLQVPRREDCSG